MEEVSSVIEYGVHIPLTLELEKIKTSTFDILSHLGFQEIGEKYTHNFSILYMVYWYHRGKEDSVKQALGEYIGNSNPIGDIDFLLSNEELENIAQSFVERYLSSKKTVDIVLIREGDEKEVFVQNRHSFPIGNALPGGMIQDLDEENNFNIPGYIYAALRVAGEKILSGKNIEYGEESEKHYYFVRDTQGEIRIHFRDVHGYRHKDDLKYMTGPSDPRHLVDTIGIKCEFVGEIRGDVGVWKKKSEIMSPNIKQGGFIFKHHRDIVAHIGSRNNKLDIEYEQHHRWVRGIIDNPEIEHDILKKSFKEQGNSINVSFPELATIAKKILDDLYSEPVNTACETDFTLRGLRDKTTISLRQCLIQNRTFCPYLPTLEAIFKGVTFFDVLARNARDFYKGIPTDRVYEHNPAQLNHASYHMYRYEYRWNEVKAKLPHEIVIPTFENLGATDLMKVRGVPIWFVGLATDFTYVDEFEQSPEEFFMHDINHSFRMIEATEKYKKEKGLIDEEFIKISNLFIKEYLGKIKILPTDSEEEKERKKLKKIILFEAVHEDARVFTQESILDAISTKEGGSVAFEVPHVNPEGMIEVVDTLDHGISPLSYVRNKLQHGFYDKIDAQITQIVHPKYRTSDWIASVALEMYEELGGTNTLNGETIDFDWFIARTCSVGPDNIHKSNIDDPIFNAYHGGNTSGRVNPKRYQV